MQQNNLPDKQQKRQNEQDGLVDGLTHQQFIEKMRQRNGEEWFRENQVWLQNPDLWQDFVSLN